MVVFEGRFLTPKTKVTKAFRGHFGCKSAPAGRWGLSLKVPPKGEALGPQSHFKTPTFAVLDDCGHQH